MNIPATVRQTTTKRNLPPRKGLITPNEHPRLPQQLASLMTDFGIGVTPVTTYEVKRVDGDHFSEEG